MEQERFGYLLVDQMARVNKEATEVCRLVRSVLIRKLADRLCLSGTDDEDVRRLARRVVEDHEVVLLAIQAYYQADKDATVACAEFLETIREAGKALVAALDRDGGRQ